MIESRALKQKQRIRAKLRNNLKNNLQKKEDTLGTLRHSQNKRHLKILVDLQNESVRLSNMDHQTKQTPDFAKAMKRLQKKVNRCEQLPEKFKHQYEKRESQWDAKIQSCKHAIECIDKELSQLITEESRLQGLITEGYMSLNTSRKAILDMCRIIARNIFYNRVNEFRPIYNNYRDDHAIFRTMTEAPGAIHIDGSNVIIRLWPAAKYTKTGEERINAFLMLMSTTLTQWMKNQTALDVSVTLISKS